MVVQEEAFAGSGHWALVSLAWTGCPWEEAFWGSMWQSVQFSQANCRRQQDHLCLCVGCVGAGGRGGGKGKSLCDRIHSRKQFTESEQFTHLDQKP